MPPAARTTESNPRNVLLARRTLSALLGLLAAISLVMVAALLLIALQLNRDAESHSQRLVDKLWEATRQQLITTTRDYAFWGDAYRALHLHNDIEWAYERDNLGASLFKTFHFEGVFVVGGQNQTTYALDQGELSTVALPDWLGSFPASLIDDARDSEDEEHVATRILDNKGQPVFLSAARLTPGSDPAVQRLPGVQSVLVLAYRLSPEKLKRLGDSYEIAQLRTPLDPEDAARQPRAQIDSQLLLRWDPERPGNRLLRVLLPILLLLLAGLLLLSLSITRRTLKTARLMDQQYAMINASRTALASSEARFRNVAEAASDWFWETTPDLRITYLSERFTAVTGQPAQAWLGRRLDEMLNSHEQPLADWVLAQQASSARSVIRCTHDSPEGEILTSLIAVRPILHEGQISGYQGSASDITREVAVEQRLRQLSWHDALTGLANRSQLREFLEAQLHRLPLQRSSLTLLSLDLDHFKPVNDLYGHSGGDSVLREVAQRMTRCLPQGALLARQGGDEFIMVAPALTDRHAVEKLCLTLIASICQPFVLNGQELMIGLSIGIACAPEHGLQSDDLLRFSDMALYQAKNNGRNTWRFYDPAMTERMQQRRELERDLHIALKHGQFSLRYQPRYEVRSGRISGAEALIRWEHPRLGQCMPDQFIGLAEENGLIVALSDWVLRRACSDAMQWPDTLLVSVNISAVEFRLGGLVERIRSVLSATGLAPHRLELELTERVVIEDAPSSLELMSALKSLGVRLAMDDFGTGYSSLSYLKDFPFDTLKIDRSFINEIDRSSQGRAIVQAIIDLGRALSLTITAEGVETGRQLQLLLELTCDEAQGYFLNRPMPLAALLQAIERQKVHALDL